MTVMASEQKLGNSGDAKAPTEKGQLQPLKYIGVRLT